MKATSRPTPKRPQPSLSILASIRLDQARKGLRVVSQSAVRKYEERAAAIHAATPFSTLAGLAR